MDYEKKYKEAIEKLRRLHDGYDTVSTLIDIKEELEHIFPELAESEDEKVREDIISLVNEFWEKIGSINPEYSSRSRMIAWLEKQGEKPIGYILTIDKDGNYTKEPILSNSSNNGKNAWSEEDEKNIEKLDGFLTEVFCYGHVYVSQKDKEDLQSWLKSLRPQNRWKPSEEQIDALDEVYKTHGANSACRRVLITLLNDLKKLKG